MYTVRNFEYDGFGGMLRKGYAPYTATLLEWTLDPGVGRFQCSDGKVRLIPWFAVPDAPDWQRPATAPANYSPLFYVGSPSRS